ncbi:MAG TPA: enoyl-CoA hydratase-related protein [Micromonospora sp.]
MSTESRRACVELEVEGAVATITLNRPEKLNAISPELRDDLEAALEEVRPGDAVRVVRIRGAGRGFCAGYDMTSGSSVYSLGEAEDPHRGEPGSTPMTGLGESKLVRDRERLRENIERWMRLWSYRKPIIAQVHGVCLAGGLDLLGICDIVYAAEDARFGHPAARGLGIPPTLGLLPMKIGLSRTKQLFFTGDLIDGVTAARYGLVDEVMPAAELEERTLRLCRRIANQPLDALTLHKHVINRWAEIMGIRLGALEGAEFNAMFHVTPASVEFGRIVASQGIRAALAWRDGAFDADDQS